jgi:hypothetical protein
MKDDEYPPVQVFFDVYEKPLIGKERLVCSFLEEGDAFEFCKRKNIWFNGFFYRLRIVK